MKKIFLSGGLIVAVLLGTIFVVAQAQKEGREPEQAGISQSESVQDPAASWREGFPDPGDESWGLGEDPFLEMERLHRKLERLMHSHFWHRPSGSGRFGSSMLLEPRIDLEETDQELVIRCDLPGLEKDKIQLTLKEDVVVIQGTREMVQQEDKTESGARVYRSERSLGSFYRAIPLPVRVDAKNAKAAYENGVLTIRLPKLVEQKEEGIQIQVT